MCDSGRWFDCVCVDVVLFVHKADRWGRRSNLAQWSCFYVAKLVLNTYRRDGDGDVEARRFWGWTLVPYQHGDSVQLVDSGAARILRLQLFFSRMGMVCVGRAMDCLRELDYAQYAAKLTH